MYPLGWGGVELGSSRKKKWPMKMQTTTMMIKMKENYENLIRSSENKLKEHLLQRPAVLKASEAD